jgi:hypothetical protein
MKVKQLHINFRKILAIGMICLLGLLCTINLFIYNDKNNSDHSISIVLPEEEGNLPGDGNANQPAGGPDEKCPDRSGSISEDYVHEQQEASLVKADKLIHTLLSIDKKISPVDFELISPPPDRVG